MVTRASLASWAPSNSTPIITWATRRSSGTQTYNDRGRMGLRSAAATTVTNVTKTNRWGPSNQLQAASDDSFMVFILIWISCLKKVYIRCIKRIELYVNIVKTLKDITQWWTLVELCHEIITVIAIHVVRPCSTFSMC